ncbi:endoplasmic reticulum junction formation protein lunapark-B-like [Ruditapes philippinarum]|uniref:endoplasmic reticulum junction formation protein lunapark-B-like n=1 Tax=Ruditapes philippinarum TaxID=129788 RepID=UPI00295A9C4C|nr:endoplasmic reticulum junction formation protein lunapark-B-like [Ruditapes philippinarum]
MGIVLSRFRKKKSTIEILEQVDQDIKRLEQFKRKNQERQKWFIAKLLLYSILLYVVSALVFYFYYFPEKWKDRLLYSIPLLLFPVVIWCVKKVLHWYFIKRIAKNDLALEELREKKKQILEDVMETETYKKAREILEKFDPARFKELEAPKETPAKPTPGTELRQRQFAQRTSPGSQPRPGVTPGYPGMTPMRPQQGPGSNIRPGMTPYGPRGSAQGIQPRNLMNSPQINGGTSQGPPLPRPVLPRERGTMDRLLEYLVGDGPQNRYALICVNCSSHNGMAMKEEFEYITFRCCYCYSVNPAKKKRPYAPRIEPPTPAPKVQATSSKDNSENNDDGSDDEDDDTGTNGNKEAVTPDSTGNSNNDDEESMEVENDAENEGAQTRTQSKESGNA